MTIMLSMNTKQEIILRYYRQGHSQRKISRELEICRKTVKKYLQEYEKERNKEPPKEGELTAVNNTILEAPKYDSSTRKKRRLTEEIAEQIDKYLISNQEKRRSGKRKQLLKKIDIWEALKGQGYQIGYTTVCNYISSQQSGAESFIRQQYEPCGVCEFDWGEVKLKIDGIDRVYQLAVFTLAWSNYRFAYLFARQDTQSFQQSHVIFFEHLGGVPHQLVYDNMRVAVKRFVGLNEKEPTDALLGMSMYYQFGFRFCNVRKGNEKGHVERSVEYIRRKAFAVQDEFRAVASANEYLFKVVEKLNAKVPRGKSQSPSDLLKKASAYLGQLPAAPMECATWEQYRVDKYSTICVKTNHYSVPEEFTGKMVEVKLYADRLDIYYNNMAFWSHQRRHTKFKWYLYLGHYLETLRRKPGALKGAQALDQASEELKSIYGKYFNRTPRQFIELLHYQRAKAISWLEIQSVISELLSLGCRDITIDKIKIRLENKPKTERLVSSPDGQTGQIEALSKEQLRQITDLLNLN